jgi:diguanylate cyclase (GGDEF)-like protein
VSDPTAQRALRPIARIAARALRMPIAVITVAQSGDPTSGASRTLSSFGLPATTDGAPEFALSAAASSEVLIVSDARRDERFAADPLVAAPPFVRFCAAVPLLTSDGDPIGSLCVFDTTVRTDLSDDDVETLRDLARLVVDRSEGDGRSSMLLEVRDAARREAVVDPLTGLANRRMLDGELERALALARRTGHAVAVLMIGLDRHGDDDVPLSEADEGGIADSVVVDAADRLARAVREHDLVAYVGSGEFVVVLQAVDRPAVAEAAGRLHETLTGPHEGVAPASASPAGRSLRVSVGVALHPVDGEDLAALLRGADVAMHEARASGGGVRRSRTA